MKIFTVQFDYEQKSDYARLLKVFVRSAEKHGHDVTVKIVENANNYHMNRMKYSNTIKLDLWKAFVCSVSEPILLADCDLMVLKNLDDVFTSTSWDIGITRHETPRPPLNAGAIYVQPTERAREFLRRWADVNRSMFEHEDVWRPWGAKYCGMNQASLGFLLEKLPEIARIRSLSCAIWNCCDSEWQYATNETRLVHFKGQLRLKAFGRPHRLRGCDGLVEAWRNYEKA